MHRAPLRRRPADAGRRRADARHRADGAARGRHPRQRRRAGGAAACRRRGPGQRRGAGGARRRGGADLPLGRPAPARAAADGRDPRRRPGDGPGAGDEADDRRRRRRDGRRPAAGHARRDAPQGAAGLPRRRRRDRRLLVPPEPDPLGQPAAVARRARPDRPARSRPRPRGARQLQRRALHLRDPDTSVWSQYFFSRSRTCSGPPGSLFLGALRGRRGARDRPPADAGRAAARRRHRRRGDRLPVHAAHRGGPRGPAARLRHQPALPGSRRWRWAWRW